MTGNDLASAPCVYVVEPAAAAAGWGIGPCADLDEIGMCAADAKDVVKLFHPSAVTLL